MPRARRSSRQTSFSEQQNRKTPGDRRFSPIGGANRRVEGRGDVNGWGNSEERQSNNADGSGWGTGQTNSGGDGGWGRSEGRDFDSSGGWGAAASVGADAQNGSSSPNNAGSRVRWGSNSTWGSKDDANGNGNGNGHNNSSGNNQNNGRGGRRGQRGGRGPWRGHRGDRGARGNRESRSTQGEMANNTQGSCDAPWGGQTVTSTTPNPRTPPAWGGSSSNVSMLGNSGFGSKDNLGFGASNALDLRVGNSHCESSNCAASPLQNEIEAEIQNLPLDQNLAIAAKRLQLFMLHILDKVRRGVNSWDIGWDPAREGEGIVERCNEEGRGWVEKMVWQSEPTFIVVMPRWVWGEMGLGSEVGGDELKEEGEVT